ncbi:hypothetical protein ACOMHN_061862 [Nucella lapillus]
MLHASETDGSQTTGGNLQEAVQAIVKYEDSVTVECNQSRFYSLDGKCNNLLHPMWGAAFVPFVRDIPNDYTDALRLLSHSTSRLQDDVYKHIMELGILHNSSPSTKRGCRAGRLHRLWHGLPPAPWPCTRSQHHSVPSRNLHPLMVPPFLQLHPELQSAVGNAPLSSKHPAQLPTTDCLLSIISPMGGQPSDAPALSPPSPLQQGGQSSNAPALSPPSPLLQGGQPIALALSPPSPLPQGGQPSDAPGLSPSSSTLLLCPSDSTLNICHLNSQSAVKTGKLIPRLYAKFTNQTELLPSTRKVTLTCFPVVDNETRRDLHRTHNQNLMQFGQYFSHDLALTPVMEGIGCCEGMDENGLHPDTFNGGPCFPINIPEHDRHFNYCMVFNRSVYEIDQSGVAQQLSSATHFIDQSTVYGSAHKFAKSIRAFENGDNRLSVFPGLTATHLIFHLEHNRVAEALHRIHPGWTDERLYQEARAIMIAETQNLVYEEYLPLVLGNKMMRFFGLHTPTSYNPKVNPSIINAFQTAAFRFGHSQINNIFVLNPYTGHNESLNHTYFRPYKLFYEGKPIYGELMLSLMTHPGQKVDPEFAFGVLDDLFLGVDAPGHSTDLPARTMQRGRDHGLPGYIDYLNKALSVFKDDRRLFRDIVLPSCVAGVYRSVEDIDIFLGGIFEDHVPGGEVGPVFAYLIGQQFKNLREGDRLFFDSRGSEFGFSKAQIRSLKRTRYSGIICRNSGLKQVPRNAFKLPHKTRNPMVDCDSIPDVDFSLWR